MFKVLNKILVAILKLGIDIKLAIYASLFKGRFAWEANVVFNSPFTVRAWGKFEVGCNCIFNESSKYNMAGIFKRNTIFIKESAELFIGDNCGF